MSRAISLAHLSLIAYPPDGLVALAADAGFGHVDLRLSPATSTDRVYGDDERMRLCRAGSATAPDGHEGLGCGDHSHP